MTYTLIYNTFDLVLIVSRVPFKKGVKNKKLIFKIRNVGIQISKPFDTHGEYNGTQFNFCRIEDF